MEPVMTAPAEKEALVETLTTSQPLKRIWRDTHFVQPTNGDHPNVLSTNGEVERDEENSWESEG